MYGSRQTAWCGGTRHRGASHWREVDEDDSQPGRGSDTAAPRGGSTTPRILKQGVVCCPDGVVSGAMGHASLSIPLACTATTRLSDLEATTGRSASFFLPCRIAASECCAAENCLHGAYAHASDLRKRRRKNLTKPAHICERTSACSEPYTPTPTPQPTHVVLHRGSEI